MGVITADLECLADPTRLNSTRVLFETVYAVLSGEDTIHIRFKREMDYVQIRLFAQHINDPVITAVLNNPETYLTEEKAKLIGGHTGQRTSRAILKYFRRTEKTFDASEYIKLADALSPIVIDKTYKFSIYKDNKTGVRYVTFDDSCDAECWDLPRGVRFAIGF